MQTILDQWLGFHDRTSAGQWLLASLLFLPYFLPTIIAAARQSRNTLPIGLLNGLLGWTIVGWVGALVWACLAAAAPPEPPPPTKPA